MISRILALLIVIITISYHSRCSFATDSSLKPNLNEDSPVEGIETVDGFKLNKSSKQSFVQNVVDKFKGKMDDLPDEVFIDHRESGCLTPIERIPSHCAASYIYAPTSLYEWQYCKETGKLVEFSEQYPIDCGKSQSGMKGCRGGTIQQTSDFYQHFGIELKSKYPVYNFDSTCSFDLNTEPNNKGYLKVNARLKKIKHSEFDNYIKLTPIIASFYYTGYSYYKRQEIDMCDAIDEDYKRRAKLIIGSGRMNGIEYWLIKDFQGDGWGIKGYYRVPKRNKNCFSDHAVGYVLEPINKGEKIFTIGHENNDETIDK